MQMTNEEIVRDYHAAANKSKQIKVLAELNDVSPGEILAVLAEAGVVGVEEPKRIVKKKPPVKQGGQATEAAIKKKAGLAPLPLPEFYSQVEAILNALPERVSREAERHTQSLLQTLFADYLHHRLEGRVHDERNV